MTCHKQSREEFNNSNRALLPRGMEPFAGFQDPLAFPQQAMGPGNFQRPMIPSAELIAEAQALRRQQELMMVQPDRNRQVEAIMEQLQQQQKLQQQQQQQQLQQQQQQQDATSVQYEERLNAAIEAEVTRRLQERVQAASLSRQALARMQQPELPLSPFAQQQQAAANQQALSQALSPNRHGGMNLMGNNDLAARINQVAAMRDVARLSRLQQQNPFESNFDGKGA